MSCSKPLTRCVAGTKGKIVELSGEDRKILGKLMSLGIIPGAAFLLLRRFPGFLLQCGHTRVALDYEMAKHIEVIE